MNAWKVSWPFAISQAADHEYVGCPMVSCGLIFFKFMLTNESKTVFISKKYFYLKQ